MNKAWSGFTVEHFLYYQLGPEAKRAPASIAQGQIDDIDTMCKAIAATMKVMKKHGFADDPQTAIDILRLIMETHEAKHGVRS